jgi:hypothetical protein
MAAQAFHDPARRLLRQVAVGDAFRGCGPVDQAQIRTWPGEDVDLFGDDPRAFVIELQSGFRKGWHFDGLAEVARWAMRYRCDDDPNLLSRMPDRDDDGTRSILATLFQSAIRIRSPKVGVPDDEAGLWIWQRHSGFVVELPREAGWFGLAQSLRHVIRQFPGIQRLPVIQ